MVWPVLSWTGLFALLAAQEAVKVTDPKPVAATVTAYEVVGVLWGVPKGFITPPTPAPLNTPETPTAGPHGPWARSEPTHWMLQILYVDNVGLYRIDEHINPKSEGNPTGGADVLVPQLLAAPSQQRWALEHLMSEGKIPPGTVVGKPIEPATRKK
jgi:hypothetical protein